MLYLTKLKDRSVLALAVPVIEFTGTTQVGFTSFNVKVLVNIF